eukprot:TRINITY_DN9786_c0_g1_i3.p1 TRINITY_DN9786_c0_g1~~TRINITY_DN9786_c0_g1_i3.p1  ORF type:complete len:190 (-),score=28.93 TRINITY_DN9786_c0_g1_i3:130-699(-)
MQRGLVGSEMCIRDRVSTQSTWDINFMDTSEKEQVINTVLSIFLCADTHDWEKALTLYVEEPFIDYSSLNGQPGGKIKTVDLLKNWGGFLPKFKSTMHFISNFFVSFEKDYCKVLCYGHAVHSFPGAEGGDQWDVYGSYDFEMVKVEGAWRARLQRFNCKIQSGNLNLPAIVSKTQFLRSTSHLSLIHI